MNILEKLRVETARYGDEPFLKAAMAVCALTILADGTVGLSERYQVDAILGAMDRLRVHNPHKAVDILDDYIEALRTEPEKAQDVLQGKILRYAGDFKSARTLLRIAYLVISADDDVVEAERRAFDQICLALTVNADEIWAKMSEGG
ncbi:MAG: TerB family tellurite resistance protein [Proteobacteria bacterium]|nr:TerB family tellurite resistance protein [Pseudomonadota bacterium]